MAGNLKQLRSVLRQFRWVCDNSKIPGEFLVIGIYSYVADATFMKSLSPPMNIYYKHAVPLFDIVITDGTDKLKCFIALPLGYLVAKNILKVGVSIQINSAKLCYLEGEYGDGHIVTYVLLENIVISERAHITFPSLNQLNFIETNNVRERECIPLVTGRKHYMNVWSTIFPHGSTWTNADHLEFIDDGTIAPTLALLGDLTSDWRRLPKPYPPLLVKVLFRGKLHHFGNNLEKQAFPWAGFFSVADSSGIVTAVCFGKINEGLYYNTLPGTILLIENYRICESREEVKASFIGDLRNLPQLNIELVVQQGSRVKIVPENTASLQQHITSLPNLEHGFVERASLQYVAQDSKIDVVGIVTYVGGYTRFKYRRNFDGYLSSYWIEMIDSSSHLPFRMLHFNNCYRYSDIDIHPGQILVCTQVKVMHVSDTIIPDRDEAVWLKASVFTEVYGHHTRSSPYIRNLLVLKVADMIRDHPQEVEYLRNNVLRMGGYYTFPPSPKNLEAYQQSFGDLGPPKMVPGADWKATFDSLVYREHQFLTVGAFIMQIEYVDFQTVESGTPTHGWAYCHNIRSRRTLFINVRASHMLTNLDVINSEQNYKFAFPQQYTSEHEDSLKSYREFPPTLAEFWRPSSEDAVHSLPTLVDGFYLFTLASLHFQAILQCMLIPEPAEQPYPSLVELLSGSYTPRRWRRIGNTFTSEPPRYRKSELTIVQRTVTEILNRTLVFSLDIRRPKTNIILPMIKRAYLCPPDQMEAAFQADRQQR